MAVIDIVIDILKINCSVAQCSGYANEFEALFFLLFFPTVFIILFVYIVSEAVVGRVTSGNTNRGLKIMIAVALFAYIVMAGYYTLFVSLSGLWWILLATLAGLWIVIHRFVKGSGGGSPMPGMGSRKGKAGRGLGGLLTEQTQRTLSGDEKDLEKEIRDSFNELEGIFNEIEHSDGEGREIAMQNFRDQRTKLRSLLVNFSGYGKADLPFGITKNITGKGKKYWDEYTKWSEKFKKIRG